jgi:hypothetical protein
MALLLHGERHTGTNFLHAVLYESFGAEACAVDSPLCVPVETFTAKCSSPVEPTLTTYCCWKHGYPNRGCHYPDAWGSVRDATMHAYPIGVFVARTPYSWLLAMYDQPYEYDGDVGGMTFSEFIRRRFWYAPEDDGYTAIDRRSNPVALWNAKLSNTTNYNNASGLGGPAVWLRHDDLYDYSALSAALLPIADMYGVPLAHGEVRYPPMCEGADCTNDKYGGAFSQQEFDEAMEYERSNAWLEMYSQADLDFVNSQIDRSLMATWGFELVTKVANSSNCSSALAALSRARAAGSDEDARELWSRAAAARERRALQPARVEARAAWRATRPFAADSPAAWCDPERLAWHLSRLGRTGPSA